MNPLTILLLLLATATSAMAGPGGGRGYGAHGGGGYGGHYSHGGHGGHGWGFRGYYRPGWVGGWYYPSTVYPPVYSYPVPAVPPTVVVSPTTLTSQPQAPVWYFCESANAYYPHVSECNGEWKTVAAAPPTPKR